MGQIPPTPSNKEAFSDKANPLNGTLPCGGSARDDAAWLACHKKDFEDEFKKDPCAQKGGWESPKKEGYWDFGQQFFLDGKRGWFKQLNKSLQKVKDPQRRDALYDQGRTLGLKIAKEWAKDNGCRKIGSGNPFTSGAGDNDLVGWGKRLGNGADADDGSGNTIERTMNEINAAADGKLK